MSFLLDGAGVGQASDSAMTDEGLGATFPASIAFGAPLAVALVASLASFAAPYCNSADLGSLSLAATGSCVFFASAIIFPSTMSRNRGSTISFGTIAGGDSYLSGSGVAGVGAGAAIGLDGGGAGGGGGGGGR